jgi:hypothetical protein
MASRRQTKQHQIYPHYATSIHDAEMQIIFLPIERIFFASAGFAVDIVKKLTK